jgi:methylenetetrahydrofolate reductase (NADPH)
VSKLSEAFERKEFVYTAEIGPPKGTDVEAFRAMAQTFAGKVHAVNVTDNQRALVKLGAIAGSLILLQEGVEPICQMVCRDRNRIGLQSDLLGAHVFGIRNILALTGDPVKVGDHPDAKAVFDMESSQLIRIMHTLNGGHDAAGKALKGATAFFPGAAINPNANNMDAELRRIERKLEAGARFIQTQAIYDAEGFVRFAKAAAKFEVPILAGILYLRSAKSARFINRTIPGIKISDDVIERFEAASDPEAEGVKYGLELVEAVRPHCAGVHLMSVGREERLVEIIDAITAQRTLAS